MTVMNFKTTTRNAKPRLASLGPVNVECFDVTGEDGHRATCFLVRREAWDNPHAMWSYNHAEILADRVLITDDWCPAFTMTVPTMPGETDHAAIVTDYLTEHYGALAA